MLSTVPGTQETLRQYYLPLLGALKMNAYFNIKNTQFMSLNYKNVLNLIFLRLSPFSIYEETQEMTIFCRTKQNKKNMEHHLLRIKLCLRTFYHQLNFYRL